MMTDVWSKEETKRFFDERAADWDVQAKHDAQKLELIVHLCGLRPGLRILDVACGTGVLFPWLLAAEPQAVVGLDLSAGMIAVARGKFTDARLTLLAQDVFDYAETGFDLITLYSAYPHFADKAALAAHLAGRLKPGGRLMLAHSEARTIINGRHSGAAVRDVSAELKPALAEMAVFAPHFNIDTVVDTDACYIISGCRKSG